MECAGVASVRHFRQSSSTTNFHMTCVRWCGTRENNFLLSTEVDSQFCARVLMVKPRVSNHAPFIFVLCFGVRSSGGCRQPRTSAPVIFKVSYTFLFRTILLNSVIPECKGFIVRVYLSFEHCVYTATYCARNVAWECLGSINLVFSSLL